MVGGIGLGGGSAAALSLPSLGQGLLSIVPEVSGQRTTGPILLPRGGPWCHTAQGHEVFSLQSLSHAPPPEGQRSPSQASLGPVSGVGGFLQDGEGGTSPPTWLAQRASLCPGSALASLWSLLPVGGGLADTPRANRG